MKRPRSCVDNLSLEEGGSGVCSGLPGFELCADRGGSVTQEGDKRVISDKLSEAVAYLVGCECLCVCCTGLRIFCNVV